MSKPVSCLCSTSELKLIAVSDNPDTGFAQNVYECESCDTIAIKRVWNNQGVTYIEPSGKVTEIFND